LYNHYLWVFRFCYHIPFEIGGFKANFIFLIVGYLICTRTLITLNITDFMSGSSTRILLITAIGIILSFTSFSQTNPKWQGAWRAADTAFVGKNGNTWKLSARKGWDATAYKGTKYYMTPKIPGYWEYLPNGYESNTSKTYPLILYFPGCGESNGGTAYLKPDGELVYRYGLGRLFFDENKFFYPGDPSVPWYNPYDSMAFPSLPTLLRDNGDYFSMVPKKTLGQVYPWGGPTEEVIVLCLAYNANPNIPCSGVQEIYPEDVDAAIERAFQLYRIDASRVYMTGMSQGAKSSWFYPAFSEANAKKIAAAAPVGSVHTVADITGGGAANIVAGGTRILSIVNRYDLNTNGTGTNTYLINLESEQAVNSIANRVILDTFFYQWQVTSPFSPSNPSTIHNGWARAYRTDTYEVPFIDNTASTPQRYTLFEWFLTNKSGAAPVVCNPPTTATTTGITQTTATLGWSAGSGNVNYTIEYKKRTDAGWSVLATDITAVSYELKGLTASTVYDWRVKGKCADGTVTAYLNATFNTLGTCASPAAPVTSGITAGAAQLSWTAAAGAVSYDVQYKRSSDLNWTVAVAGTTGTAYNLSGLSEGTTYNWRVRTNCQAGATSAFVEAQFTTAGTIACNVPQGLTSGTITASSAQLSWTAVSGAASYDVEYKAAPSTSWIVAVAASTGTAYNLSGLAASTSYNWRVRTNCTSASSSYAEAQFTTTASVPVGNCPTPTGLATNSITYSAAQFTWNWVGAASYTFEYKPESSDTWIVASTTIQGSSYGLYTLSAGTTYDWRLRSNCGANGSSIYVASQFTTLTCNPPTSLTSSNIGNTSAQLSWVAIAGASNYALEYKTAAAQTWTVASREIWGTSFTLFGLQTGTQYEWRVRSNCSNSGGSVYASAQFTTTGGAPACNPPSGLSSGSITVSSALLSWSSAGSAVSYDVEYKKASDPTWVAAATSISATSYSLADLSEATSYDWRVRAACGTIGTSGFASAQFTTKSTAVVCDAPSGLTSGSITVSSALLSWAAADGAVSYNVEYKASSSNTWIIAASGITTTSYSLAGLAAGTSYDWRVRTNCGASGNSGYSSAQFTTTSTNPPVGNCTAPGSLQSGSISNSSAQFSWTWVGAASYTFEYKAANSNTWIVASTTILGSSYALYNLQSGTTYDWRVRSNCGANGSSVYVASQFTTLACPAPTGLTVGSVTNTTAQVSWSWVGGTSYRVEYKAASAVNWTVLAELNQGTSSFITGLTAGTNYQWQVRTNCGNSGSSIYMASQFATTGALNTGNISQQGMMMETSDWKVFPVPAKGYLNFSFSSATQGKADVLITDLSGRTVKKEPVQVINGANNMRIDLNGIRPGMYLLRMAGKDNSRVSKIIVQ